MEKAILATSRVFGYLGTLSLVVLMLAITLDVAVRFVTRSSVPGMLELAETALVASGFLGAAWTALQGAHVDVDAITSRMKPRALRVTLLCIWTIATVTLAWLSYATVVRAIQSTSSHESRFGLLDWPLYPTRWIIAIGLVLWTLVAITNVARLIRGRLPWGENAEAPLGL